MADILRQRIITGQLGDGDLLPKEADLRVSFPVSKPSLREAMRILEAEGLIRVRRGNVGGAVVHRPTSANVAYTLALVLSANRSAIPEVARAIRECEPACAALCAERRDRRRQVVPRLRALQKEAMDSVGDLFAATSLSRQFHEAIVALCGNEPLIVIIGALEKLWSSHERGWADQSRHSGSVPVEERRAALETHAHMIDLIAAGEADEVRDLSRRHLEAVQAYPSSGPAVDLSVLREQMG